MTSVLRVAHVGQVRAELERLDEALPRLAPALDAEGHDRARPAAAGSARVVGVRRVGLVGVGDPRHPRVLAQEGGDGARVGDVAVHAQRERLEALQEQERVERAHTGPRSRIVSTRAFMM